MGFKYKRQSSHLQPKMWALGPRKVKKTWKQRREGQEVTLSQSGLVYEQRHLVADVYPTKIASTRNVPTTHQEPPRKPSEGPWAAILKYTKGNTNV